MDTLWSHCTSAPPFLGGCSHRNLTRDPSQLCSSRAGVSEPLVRAPRCSVRSACGSVLRLRKSADGCAG